MPRPLPFALFALAALSPALLLAWGAAGHLPWAAFLYMTLFAGVMDRASPRFMGNAPEGAEFPASDPLLAALALAHLALVPILATAIATPAPWTESLGLFLGAALWMGQVSNPTAHELIHRSARPLFWLGAAVYTSMAFGHHTSAHRLVHHRHAASPLDPNTARSGEGFYAFFLRAWTGSFRAGLAAETALRARAQRARGAHPYAAYILGALAMLALMLALGGARAALVWAGLSLMAQAQLMLSDYVQHYGLARKLGADGKYEPVAMRHSWNAPFWYSSALMLNAPRHSDHHAHPARPYPALRLPEVGEAPRLPWPLPIACTIALMPPLWKRAIRPHLRPWLA